MSRRALVLLARGDRLGTIADFGSAGLLLCAAFALAACSAGEKDRVVPTAGAGGSIAPAVPDAGVIESMPICGADNPFCSPMMTAPIMQGTAPIVPISNDCGSLPIDIKSAGVNIMIAVDGAAGMMSHWQNVETAVRSLRENNPTASFGLHLFWADPVDPFNPDDTAASSNMTNNACKTMHDKILPLGAHTSQELLSTLGNQPPGGTIFDVYQVDPLIVPLNRYIAQASELADPKKTNYLLVFTSGNDNCFGSAFAGREDKLYAFQKLAVELAKRNIRTIPIGVDPPSTMPTNANPFGPTFTGTDQANIKTDYDVLGTLLKYGGSGLTEVPRIDNAAKLQELVSKVGQTINSCRFEIPAALDSSMSVNPFELSFNINGKDVPRDRHQTMGWDFVNGSTTQVEFFGPACQALQAGVRVESKKTCSQDVCGTAAVSVSTKPRSVLMLLDSSQSRTECIDGSLSCLSLPGTEGRSLTFWEVVEHAVSESLISPINDDVGFGIQFFPSKNAATFSCDVGMAPEIPPATGEQIDIVKAMLEKLPLGLTPLVAAMESVAATPGKLVDPGVLGAVLLLSDGGDNCSGGTQAEIVSRVGAASKKLLDRGVKTYAVRFGSKDGDVSEWDEQLNAIVTNGGTAVTGAGTAKYVDAKTPDDLAKALASISDKLASCSFTLGGVPATVDKNRTNLFMNGDSIGFDSKGTKTAGWGWVDAGQTTVELYGEACTAFKTNRRTNIVAEFGCEQVVIDGPQ